MKRPIRVAACTVLSGALLAGCGFSGVYDTPLPGGADLGENPVTVRTQLRDVVDLVPQSSVKLNDVPIGKVTDIALATDAGGTWVADVTMQLNRGAGLPSNSTAELKQTSLLGEKYIELTPPPRGAQRQAAVSGGERLAQSTVSRHVETEQVLGALSMLLNRGGLEQIRTISRELQDVNSGNTGELRALLTNVNTLAGGLDARSADITTALDGLNRLSGTLDGQKDEVAEVLDNIGPGLKTLRDQRGQLVEMLRALDRLSGIAIDTVNKSRDDLVANLETLRPTLRKLAEAGKSLPESLELLLTFPFPDNVVEGIKGDYLNLYIDVDLDLGQLLDNLSRSRQVFPGKVSGPILSDLTGGDPGQQVRSGQAQPGQTRAPQRQQPPPGGQQSGARQPAPELDVQQPITGLNGLLGELMGGGY